MHLHFLNKTSKFFTLFVSSIIVFFFANCNKNDDSNTQNRVGTILGVISPADAAFVVRATSSAGIIFSYYVDAAGHYNISNLSHGNYSLQAYLKGGYSNQAQFRSILIRPTSCRIPSRCLSKMMTGKWHIP